LLFLLGLALGGARLYLSSGRAARQAAAHLTALFGSPVEVGSARIGLFGSSELRNVKALDGDAPWLTIDEAQADASALSLLCGSPPARIAVRGAHLILRFDRAGNLLTRLPAGAGGALPNITFADSRVTLAQEGRPPLVLHNVRAELTASAGGAALEGDFDDPHWGRWQLSGQLSVPRGDLTLKSAGVALRPALLERLPFVPPAIWEQVKLDGPDVPIEVALRFAPEEDVALRYRVAFSRARLTLPQKDRKPLVLRSVQATIDGDDDGLALHGAITDEYWGAWNVFAGLTARTGAITLEIETPDTFVDQVKLDAVPYVPPSVWEAVQFAEGRTPVKVTVGLFTSRPDVRYRVELAPRNTRLHIRSIDLDVEGASGEVTIADAVVQLCNVKGSTAGGTIVTNANLDFRGDTSRLSFHDVRVHNVTMSKLPRAWGLPEEVDGKLTGAASLTLDVGNGKTRAYGSGKSEITEASLVGFPTFMPIKLNLRGNGEGLTLGSPMPLLQKLLAATGRAHPVAPPWAPLDTLHRLPQTTAAFLHRAADGAVFAARRVAQLQRPLPPGQAPTYLEAKVSLEDVDLTELARRLRLKLPFPLAGKMAVRVALALPIDAPRDLKAYRLDGTATFSRLRIADLDLAQVKARVRYAKGVLRLEEMTGSVRRPGLAGKLLSPGKFRGSANLGVVPAGELRANLKIDGLPLAQALSLLPGGAGDVTGVVAGDLRFRAPSEKLRDPAAWVSSASLHAERVTFHGLELRSAAARLSVARDGAGIAVEDIKATLYRGELTGTALVPVRADVPGRADLRVKDVDVQELARTVPEVTLRLEGRVSGSVKGQLEAAPPGGSRAVRADVEVTAPRLRVEGLAAQRLKGNVHYQGGRAAYRLEGEGLGGKFMLEGKVPPLPGRAAPRPEGRLRIERMGIGRLLEGLKLGPRLGQLRGTFSCEVPYDHGADGWPVGRGRFELRDLRWNDVELSDSLQGDVRVDGKGVRLSDVSGSLAGGLLRLHLSYALRGRRRGSFNLVLSQAELGRLLALADAAEVAQGPINVSLRGSLGGEWRGGGNVVLTRGKALGVELSEWRLPVDFIFAPVRGHGELSVRDSVAQFAGGGRGQFQTTLTWAGGSMRVEGQLRLFEAALRSLAGALGEGSSHAQGRLNGRVDFAGGNVHSLQDLSANVQATFNQAQALQLPVLRQLAPYLLPGQSSATFQSGEMQARLANGILRVQRLGLSGNFVRFLVQGTVTLQGRLDLDVQARSGPFATEPLGVMLQAGSYLANQVVRLRVSGTVRQPIIRVEPAGFLTEEAVRFFLGR
jgi:hypothetical protein